MVKGVCRGEDARSAAEHGAKAVVVSNHGGRQLDTAPATCEALPYVVEAAGDLCEIYVDGGIRRGSDVLKAIALGARAVLVGRPVLWGLCVAGEQGATSVLEIFGENWTKRCCFAGAQSSAMSASGCWPLRGTGLEAASELMAIVDRVPRLVHPCVDRGCSVERADGGVSTHVPSPNCGCFSSHR